MIKLLFMTLTFLYGRNPEIFCHRWLTHLLPEAAVLHTPYALLHWTPHKCCSSRLKCSTFIFSMSRTLSVQPVSIQVLNSDMWGGVGCLLTLCTWSYANCLLIEGPFLAPLLSLRVPFRTSPTETKEVNQAARRQKQPSQCLCFQVDFTFLSNSTWGKKHHRHFTLAGHLICFGGGGFTAAMKSCLIKNELLCNHEHVR